MPEPIRYAYVNGEVLPESEAKVSIRDLGFIYGDAVFDTARTFGGKVFRLEQHIDRLFHSLRYARIDPDLVDRIADETVGITEDEILPFLEEKGHPALSMDPLIA